MDEIIEVSRMIVNSCTPLYTEYNVPSMVNGIPLADLYKEHNIDLIGSRAEFFINRINDGMSHADFLITRENESAVFDENYKVNIQHGTAREFSRDIMILFMERNECPLGYFNLRGRCEMKYHECSEDVEKWHFSRCVSNNESLKTNTVGFIREFVDEGGSETVSKKKNVNVIEGVRCVGLPPEAEQWSTRERVYGWPSLETIKDVISTGCDLINESHEDHKGDQVKWKLYFARAEVVLLRSWTRTQQIVYHMLRYFTEQELMKEERVDRDAILNCYHIKTLMLWSCEEKKTQHLGMRVCNQDLCSSSTELEGVAGKAGLQSLFHADLESV